MLKIGAFSKVSLVPVKTLRYYDEIGLFQPAQIDQWTGYRYYTIDQLPRLNRILALKDLGFSLEQITRLLDGGMTAEQMREILQMKQHELHQQLRAEEERLTRVAWRLQQIEQEGQMSNYDVIVKHVEPQLVASLREVVPTYPDIGRLFNEVYAHLGKQGIPGGMCAAIYHDGEYRERDVDNEAIVFLEQPIQGTDRITIYTLPGSTMASLVYQGSYSGLSNAYRGLMEWISAHGYEISGPEREIYLRSPATPGDQNDPNCVTEIQFPVSRT